MSPLVGRHGRGDLEAQARRYNALTAAMALSLAMARSQPGSRAARQREFSALREQQRAAAAGLVRAARTR